MRNSRAVDLLEAAVAESSIQAVANRLERGPGKSYSRPALSRYLSDSYPNPERLEAAILEELDKRDCPHSGEAVAIDYCRSKASGPRPFGGLARGKLWDTCQTCQNNPNQGEPK